MSALPSITASYVFAGFTWAAKSDNSIQSGTNAASASIRLGAHLNSRANLPWIRSLHDTARVTDMAEDILELNLTHLSNRGLKRDYFFRVMD